MRVSRYGRLKDLYPVHYVSFCRLQARSKEWELIPDFTDDSDGLLLFIEEIGPVPEGMIKPTVGRFDHGKGYIVGNFAWQSNLDNIKDARSRVTDETRKKLSDSRKGRTPSDTTRHKMSGSQKGRIHSDATKQKISAANLGRVLSGEVIQAMRRRVLSEGHRQKISDTMKKRRQACAR